MPQYAANTFGKTPAPSSQLSKIPRPLKYKDKTWPDGPYKKPATGTKKAEEKYINSQTKKLAKPPAKKPNYQTTGQSYTLYATQTTSGRPPTAITMTKYPVRVAQSLPVANTKGSSSMTTNSTRTSSGQSNVGSGKSMPCQEGRYGHHHARPGEKIGDCTCSPALYIMQEF